MLLFAERGMTYDLTGKHRVCVNEFRKRVLITTIYKFKKGNFVMSIITVFKNEETMMNGSRNLTEHVFQ